MAKTPGISRVKDIKHCLTAWVKERLSSKLFDFRWKRRKHKGKQTSIMKSNIRCTCLNILQYINILATMTLNGYRTQSESRGSQYIKALDYIPYIQTYVPIPTIIPLSQSLMIFFAVTSCMLAHPCSKVTSDSSATTLSKQLPKINQERYFSNLPLPLPKAHQRRFMQLRKTAKKGSSFFVEKHSFPDSLSSKLWPGVLSQHFALSLVWLAGTKYIGAKRGGGCGPKLSGKGTFCCLPGSPFRTVPCCMQVHYCANLYVFTAYAAKDNNVANLILPASMVFSLGLALYLRGRKTKIRARLHVQSSQKGRERKVGSSNSQLLLPSSVFMPITTLLSAQVKTLKRRSLREVFLSYSQNVLQ